MLSRARDVNPRAEFGSKQPHGTLMQPRSFYWAVGISKPNSTSTKRKAYAQTQ
jgi:hypothetical protein